MKEKKYLWTLAAVYMAYIAHGMQAIILSQNLDQFADKWGTDAAGIYAIIAYTGLAKFLSVWVCGELSDKFGRKIIMAAGAVMYVLFFGGLLMTSSYAVASVCAFLAGLATSFLDGGCYPAAQESWTSAPGSAVILIKGFISVSGLLYPMLVVSFRASGNWTLGIILPLIASILLLALTLVAPYSYDAELKERKANGVKNSGKTLDADAIKNKERFLVQPPKFVPAMCAVYGFIAMATMYSAQQLLTRFGLKVLGMSEITAASLTSIFTAGSLIAVVLWAFAMSKLRWRTITVLLFDTIGSVVAYTLVCTVRSEAVVQFAALAIGFFAAGGALQCGVSLIQEFNPGNKGRNLGIYYTFMGCASYTLPVIQSKLTASVGEADGILRSLQMNLVLSAIGVLMMLYLASNYKKWFGVSPLSRVEE